ncbi:MAG: GAF domain-containing protein [Anaerolineales bacterium]|nr:GAF domain-containing protein [Anaerolineales bacterium]
MKNKPVNKRRIAKILDIIITIHIVGYLIWGLLTQTTIENNNSSILLIAFFSLILSGFPLYLFDTVYFSALNFFILTAAFLNGIFIAGAGMIIGVSIGTGLWAFLFRREEDRSIFSSSYSMIASNMVSILLSLIIAFPLFKWTKGIANEPDLFKELLSKGSIILITYIVFHALFFLAHYFLKHATTTRLTFRDKVNFLIGEVFLTPFVFLVVSGYFGVDLVPLVVIGGMCLISGVFGNFSEISRMDAQRRVKGISTLHDVSLAMQATMDMDELLEVIRIQISEILQYESFYLALVTDEKTKIEYPLAVKNGVRESWSQRELMDRLTDRVILQKEAILLSRNAHKDIERLGLESSDQKLHSWLGVPLLTPDRSIGCLCAFTYDSRKFFTPADQELFTILASQMSTAIENALLYEQSQKRTHQLESLNHMATRIAASLKLSEVLEEVCKAAVLLSNAVKSAVFLIDQNKSRLFLAHGNNLSDNHILNNRSIPLTYSNQTLCLQTGTPMFFSKLGDVSYLTKDDLAFYEHEKIKAFAQFPLESADGYIGYILIYFDHEHAFIQEEIDLMKNVASQAAIALANARLHARTDQALARRAEQLSILESIGRQISAAIYSEDLFETILNYALGFTDSDAGAILVRDDLSGVYTVKASKGYFGIEGKYPELGGIIKRAVGKKEAEIVNDVSGDPDFINHTKNKTRSQLTQPLLYDENVIGVLVIESFQVGAYSDADLTFMEQLSNQVSIAIQNAVLYQQAQQRLEEQTTLYMVNMRLSKNIDIDNVLYVIMTAVQSAIPKATTAIYLWNENTQMFEYSSFTGDLHLNEQQFPQTWREEDFSLSSQNDPQDTGSLYVISDRMELRKDHSIHLDGQVYVFPLTVANKLLGIVLTLSRQDRALNEKSLQLPQAIVAQGAIALQNALSLADILQGNERLETVLNSVVEGIILVDNDGRILLVNRAIQEFFGTPARKHYPGLRMNDLSEEELFVLGYSLEDFQNVVTTEPGKKINLKPKAAYLVGKCVYVRDIVPLVHSVSYSVGWLIVIRNVTEEFELEQAREIITETLVHDLRSPMGAIVSVFDLLDELLPPLRENDVQRSLDIGKRSTKRVLNLIESLLDIYKFESGTLQPDTNSINLHQLLNEMIAEQIPRAAEINLEILTTFPNDEIEILGDRSMFERVFTNILDNALKFSPDGASIEVKTFLEEGDQVRVQVNDYGPGIPENYRDRIFDRFAQGPHKSGRKKGTGLGLTFCRLAVEAHGGKIWVEPYPRGGSSFNIQLPING